MIQQKFHFVNNKIKNIYIFKIFCYNEFVLKRCLKNLNKIK
uniref:Uncharacterized protein n=1 Tax=Siphoviridae sp. ctHip2 TaxID=2827830 RepID=A0A8S5RVX6_9CAUD|nr:MAG TPA: hypothetical protein [Siphoviridae sp. ctHip2]